MASGFLNMISYWLFFLSSVIMVISLFVEAGPAAAGWTIYPPLSALPMAQPGSGMGMTLWLVSMAIFIASSLMGSLNYIVTVLNLRTKGMSMTRLPLTIWAFFVTAVIGVISFPVLLSAALLLIMDRSFGTSFFLSDIFIQGEVLHYQGGSPVRRKRRRRIIRVIRTLRDKKRGGIRSFASAFRPVSIDPIC